MSLPTESFAWKYDVYPNEHLDERGRYFVAGKVAGAIKILDE